MGGRLPDEAIREVRERASITDVVSDVVTLRRRGRSGVGLCPFHVEKTPSFTVSEERGFFHCFGCGEHGDVFAFVMKTQSLAFPDAVRRIADRFGIALPETASEARRPSEPLAAANAAAAAFFQAELGSGAGARARAYLTERGLDAAVIARFRLGYAPAAGDALVRHLRAKRVPVEDALAAGLVGRRDRPDGGGSLYDRFRDRIVFPITDGTGTRIVAFGGRLLPGRSTVGEPPPKYLNSPESPLFRKGHTLYGLAHARDAIRRAGRAVVVEGYLDVIALAQAGIAEAVAPLGTALTVDQLRILRRMTDTVVACFDGDTAGRRAAARSFAVFVEAGLWGRGVFLPPGDDPDTFVRAQGREAFEARLATAEPLVEAYLVDLAGPRADAVGRRAEAAREVARVLARVRSPFEYGVLAALAAQRLGVREEVLRAEAAPEPPAAPPRPAADRARSAEEVLVELMAADRTVVDRVLAENVIREFEHPAWRRAAETLAAGGSEVDHAAVVQALPRELRDRVVRRLLGEVEGEDRERAVGDCIARIRARGQRRRRGQLQEELRAAEARGDAAGVETVMRRLKSLIESEQTEKTRT
jgi:DNA primase